MEVLRKEQERKKENNMFLEERLLRKYIVK